MGHAELIHRFLLSPFGNALAFREFADTDRLFAK